LRECLDSEGTPRGLVVTGAAGVGKTRLVTEGLAAAEQIGRATARATATAVAQTIPLGAFAHLLPAEETRATTTLELLREARHSLVASLAASPLVLCVDDAHLLDPASATLLQQLVAAGGVVAFVTLRTGETVPDAVTALWKDHECAYLELQPLSRAETSELLELVLGGPVEGRAEHALWQMSRGTPLVLRELVLDGVERGVLAERAGLWCWHGELGVSHRLRDLVSARIGDVDAEARDVLEVVAMGEPVPSSWLTEKSAVDTLLRRQVLGARREGRRIELRFTHPIYAEVVRAGMDPARAIAVNRRLADALESDGAHRRGDLLRLAMWRLEGGGEASSQLLVDAARLADLASSPVLAERLARAAEDAGGGFPARFAVARALVAQGRLGDAEAALRVLAADATNEAERVAVTEVLARTLAGGLERPEEAAQLVAAARATLEDATLQGKLALTEGWILFRLGRPSEAAAVVAEILDNPEAAELVRVSAAAFRAQMLAHAGRTEEAVALSERWIALARGLDEESPRAVVDLTFAYGAALFTLGRLQDAEVAAAQLYGLAIDTDDTELLGLATLLRGIVALARGRITSARKWSKGGVELLRAADPRGLLPWMLALMALAAAQAGDAVEAASAATEAAAAQKPGTWIYSEYIERANAWARASEGATTEAQASALRAAELSASRGQLAAAFLNLHDLSRFGGFAEAAPRLASLAADVDGRFVRICADHAEALMRRTPDQLEQSAVAFEEVGALLFACEAMAEAATMFRDQGREASARSCAARARVLRTQCEGARTPILDSVDGFEELTRREREIATLAARGVPNKGIARRLVISVRTVENQLQRAYRKLGVTSRQELASLLEADHDP
jgi:DNA-binding CsgD family transcriptional regulator